MTLDTVVVGDAVSVTVTRAAGSGADVYTILTIMIVIVLYVYLWRKGYLKNPFKNLYIHGNQNK